MSCCSSGSASTGGYSVQTSARVLGIGFCLIALGCGGGPTVAPSPTPPTFVITPPTPTPPTPTPQPTSLEITGRVVSTIFGQPLAGVTVTLAGLNATTDSTGAFRYELPLGSPSTSTVSISGAGIVTRTSQLLTTAAREVTLDAIRIGDGGFDLDYYRRLVRDDLDHRGALKSLRRWTRAPMVYLKTVDELGVPIDSPTLEAVAAALVDDPSAWTGGRFGISSVTRGTESRIGQPGWLTVRWIAPVEKDVCGRAQIGQEGGWIEFNHRSQNCACGSSRIGPGFVWHELGHAFGFYHTGSSGDSLVPALNQDAVCRQRPSARERFHASVAYSRPFGNQDQDNDPTSFTQSHPREPIVIVD
jgi:hypothetical protein